MARPTLALVHALRETATRLEASGVVYKWSHFAHCNCGHLAQTITGQSPQQIYRAASRDEGDWRQQAARFEWAQFDLPDYGDRPALDEGAWSPEDLGACTVTGSPMTVVFEHMHDLGLTGDDVGHLERLSDPKIRRRLGTNTVDYPHHRRENVVAYLRAWADLLEDQLPADVVALNTRPALGAAPLAAE